MGLKDKYSAKKRHYNIMVLVILAAMLLVAVYANS